MKAIARKVRWYGISVFVLLVGALIAVNNDLRSKCLNNSASYCSKVLTLDSGKSLLTEYAAQKTRQCTSHSDISEERSALSCIEASEIALRISRKQDLAELSLGVGCLKLENASKKLANELAWSCIMYGALMNYPHIVEYGNSHLPENFPDEYLLDKAWVAYRMGEKDKSYNFLKNARDLGLDLKKLSQINYLVAWDKDPRFKEFIEGTNL